MTPFSWTLTGFQIFLTEFPPDNRTDNPTNHHLIAKVIYTKVLIKNWEVFVILEKTNLKTREEEVPHKIFDWGELKLDRVDAELK